MTLVYLRERYTGRVKDTKWVDSTKHLRLLNNLLKRNGSTLSVMSDTWAYNCYNPKTFNSMIEAKVK